MKRACGRAGSGNNRAKMNLLWSGWRCIILLLSFSIQRRYHSTPPFFFKTRFGFFFTSLLRTGCPLLLTGSVRSIGCGFLTVEPSRLFRLGSNLTVYCHNTNCERW